MEVALLWYRPLSIFWFKYELVAIIYNLINHDNKRSAVCIKTRSLPALLPFKDQVAEQRKMVQPRPPKKILCKIGHNLRVENLIKIITNWMYSFPRLITFRQTRFYLLNITTEMCSEFCQVVLASVPVLRRNGDYPAPTSQSNVSAVALAKYPGFCCSRLLCENDRNWTSCARKHNTLYSFIFKVTSHYILTGDRTDLMGKRR